jgi:predicted phosphodiesterase
MSRILVIGDIHEPVSHPAYLQFCLDLYDSWDCDQTIFIGDVVDHHAISFHANHPEAPGPKDEYKQAWEAVQKWHQYFPEATVTQGNHDLRVVRLAETVNIPQKFLRPHDDVWDTPGWTWVDSVEADGVHYEHGTGHGGKTPAFNATLKMHQSCVMGHVHSVGGIKPTVGPKTRLFGMDTGCGIDERAIAFAYGKHLKERPVLSAGVVIDGHPYYEMMPCSRGEKYSRAKWERKSRKHRRGR